MMTIAIATAIAAAASGCGALGEPASVPHEGVAATEFHNPPGSDKRRSFVWRLPRLAVRLARNMIAPVTQDRSHIMNPADAARLRVALEDQDSITWIGHMTVLIELDGVTILTDPWFGEHGTPVPVGPRRLAPPSIAVEDLPPIDIVLVSHGHYDHLDIEAIERLPGHERATAVVPLGLGHFFAERNYGRVVELDWQDSVDVDGITLTALPAIHWSKRRLFHMNDTLWAAFAIEAEGGPRIFFGGDSDFGPIHESLGARWGGFDIALLSIGGFHNPGVHCTPETCVEMAEALHAEVIVPLHWGTIYLGEGPPSELPARFVDAAREHGYAEDEAWVMQIGETRALPEARDARVLAAAH
jgi:N-acyl-phosphatidylethanolamine-hydrolysing phospholipase D